MNIIQINRQDVGGAGNVALQLHKGYQQMGYNSEFFVDKKRLEQKEVQELGQGTVRYLGPYLTNFISNKFPSLAFNNIRINRICNLIEYLGQPKKLYTKLAGQEDFNYPATWKLLQKPSFRPNILHFHNLYGEYFDLRVLPEFSQRLPVFLTLHDFWLLTGHCSQVFECNRWQNGCGKCPDLGIYPPLLRDGTASNWQRKKTIYGKSQLYVATPCRWLMQKVENSILADGIVEARVINNGIDLDIFKPSLKPASLRDKLDIPQKTIVLLFVAVALRKNTCKDYETINEAVKIVTNKTGRDILFIGVGGEEGEKKIKGKRVHLRFLPYQKPPELLAELYQLADIYLHAAKVDTYPTVIMEAMACGTPVIATAVGGIPEQIQEGITGLLTSPRSSESLAEGILHLINNDRLRRDMGQAARKMAVEKFDVRRMVNDYANWYAESMEDRYRKERD